MIQFVLTLLLLLTFSSCSVNSSHVDSEEERGSTSVFLKTQGIDIIDSTGQPIQLRGVAFGNEVWYNSGIPRFHHQTEDYRRVKEMGMNFVRFYLHTGTFEETTQSNQYKESGWAWLDSNIAWAKTHGIYLNLNVHVPPGGFQSNGEGGALWDDASNQLRLKSFWAELAKRYAEEPTIASYDLLNEPSTTESIDQWQTLAQELVDTIRTLDTNHIIIVEKLLTVIDNWSINEQLNYVFVDDPMDQIVYQFHFYEPIEYTHQNTAWTTLGEGGSYPDENRLSPVSTQWVGDENLITLPEGDRDWQAYESGLFTYEDSSYNLLKPSIQASLLQDGSLSLRGFEVLEYSPEGQLLGTLHLHTAKDSLPLYVWSENDDLDYEYVKVSDQFEHHFTGSQSYANASLSQYRFEPKWKHSYKVKAELRGQNIPSTAIAGFKFDFEWTEQQIFRRNQAALKHSLLKEIQFIHQQGYPIYLGEFGLYSECFEGKGGLQWVEDVLDVLEEEKIHWTYHSYHEDHFGIYRDGKQFPHEDLGRKDLIQLFKNKLIP